jgi:hypothetical protein
MIEESMKSITQIWEKFITKVYPTYKNDTLYPTKEIVDEIELQRLYSVNLDILKDIVIRVNKRDAYFRYFHNNMRMSEYTETALYAFWIVSLKPFSLSQEYFDPCFTGRINEEFSLYYIFTLLCNIANHEAKNAYVSKLGEDMYREIVYSLQYRDISKEALMLIVELLAKIVVE